MFEKELKVALLAAQEASKVVMKFYKSGFDVEIKEDNSPVTSADIASDKIIKEILKSSFPDYAFLTEESGDDLSRIDKEFVWIIDPIDGTKDFIAKDDQFTINIALCHFHEIVIGIVASPATREIYYAVKGEGSYYLHDGNTTQIHVNNKTDELTCFSSVFHLNDFERAKMASYGKTITNIVPIGASLKACYIAHGKGELSFRFSPNTKEWDTAAPELILEEAGGIFIEPDGSKLTYNRFDVYNRNGYVMANRKENIK